MRNCRCHVIPKGLSQAEIRELAYERYSDCDNPATQRKPFIKDWELLFWDVSIGLVLAAVIMVAGFLILDVMYRQAYGSSLLLEILNSIGWINGDL